MEITALAMDGAGNVYAAGVGTKPARQPGAAAAAGDGDGGGDDYVFAAGVGECGDGEYADSGGVGDLPDCGGWKPEKLVSLKDDVVYALAFRNGSLLAATGNRGRVYRVDTAVAGQFTDVAHLEAAQGMAFAAAPGGLLVATSNSGKVFRAEGQGGGECDVYQRGV